MFGGSILLHSDTVKFGLPSFVLMTDTCPANNQDVTFNFGVMVPVFYSNIVYLIKLHDGDDIRVIRRIVSSITGWKS